MESTMRTSKICALMGRGAVIAVLGAATLAFAAAPAAARITFDQGDVTVWSPYTFDWGSAPMHDGDAEVTDTGLEERTFDWG
jgi:hypothetical protein